MTQTMRQVEYYRLWPGHSGNAGIWDTSFIKIPLETLDDRLDDAVQEATAKVAWCKEKPVIVGVYSYGENSDPESIDPVGLLNELLSLSERFRARMDSDERNAWTRISAAAADLREEENKRQDGDPITGG
jgi:hypothetical protein